MAMGGGLEEGRGTRTKTFLIEFFQGFSKYGQNDSSSLDQIRYVSSFYG